MIRVEIHQRDGYTFEISMTGHAGAERVNGIDEVCASASILMCTLAYAMQNAHQEQLGDISTLVMESGNSHLVYTSRPSWYVDTKSMFEFVLLGMRMMEQQYPQCIQVGTNLCI